VKETARADAPLALPAMSLAVALALALLALCAALLGPAPEQAQGASAIGAARPLPYCLPELAVAFSRRLESA
jgi:hypothetical protein